MQNPSTNRVAVVTGAASGIGKAIAQSLSKEEYRVVMPDMDEAGGQSVARQLGGHFIYADLRKKESCKNIVDETIDLFGTVHVLVNNAGFQHMDQIDNFSEEIWVDMISVMLTAPFLLTKYAWPTMKAQRWGRIVNIASVHGLVASPFKSAYVTAKHGLIGLTRTSALEGGSYGITVNAVCPAYVRTPLVEKQIQDQSRYQGIPTEEVIEKIMLEGAAIKRLIEPDEVASLVSYLCSDKASAITGSAWTIDLGWTAR